MISIGGIVEALKLSPKFFVLIGGSAVVVFSLPFPWREYLGYEGVVQQYRGWINLIGMGLVVFGFGLSTWNSGARIRRGLRIFVMKRCPDKALRGLSRQEKECLAQYVKHDEVSRPQYRSHGVPKLMAWKGFLTAPSDLRPQENLAHYVLEPWVVNGLSKYPEVRRDILAHYPTVKAETTS